MTKQGIRDIIDYLNKIKRPILGDKVLLVVYERVYERTDGVMKQIDYNRRAMNDVIPILERESIANHDFIDILWLIENKKSSSLLKIPTTLDVISLDNTYREDVLKYVVSKFIRESTAEYILKSIRYSWKLYKIYESELLSEMPALSSSRIDKIITTKIIASPEKIVLDIVLGKKSGVKEYYKLCSRYSKRWVDSALTTVCQKTLKIKHDYYIERSIHYTDLNNDYNRKYKDLVLNTREVDIFILHRLLRGTRYGVEFYLSDNTIGALNF